MNKKYFFNVRQTIITFHPTQKELLNKRSTVTRLITERCDSIIIYNFLNV